ncbi:hypothetical protein ACJIZ3_021402 [Penstemon smallii]|uniref:Rad7 n=1 Tax=Penstemon smallii TaxID=265156 RepID=A0ABD3SMB0_9LAMI
MTVTRSRKVLPNVNPKSSQSIGFEKGVVEPVTPCKNLEFLNHLSNSTTPTSSCSPKKSAPIELGVRSGGRTVKVMETGIVRRRSLRLATKLGVNGYLDGDEVMSGKSKKVESDDERNCSDCEVEESVEVQQNLGDGVVNQLVMNEEEVEDGGTAVKLGLDCNAGTVGLETTNNGKRKRKLSEEMKLLGMESGGKDELSTGILNLRSGKRVVKEDMKGSNGSAGSRSERLDSSKESQIMLSGDVLVKNILEASMEEGENCGSREMLFSRADKGKRKVGCETSSPENFDVDDRVGDSDPDASDLFKSSDSKEVAKDKGSLTIESGSKARRRLSKEEKGKMKIDDEDSSFRDINKLEIIVENVDESNVSSSIQSEASAAVQDEVQVSETDVGANDAVRTYRQRFRNVARRIASRFAHFTSQDELGNQDPDVSGPEIKSEPDSGIEDWPGPFSTAMKIIKDRDTRKSEHHVTSTDKFEAAVIWIPAKQEKRRCPKPLVPSLQELCLSVLAKNADAITSFDCVPDMLRHQICWHLCDSRRMNAQLLELLVHGSPTEIRLRDCSWLTEELFTKIFEGCITNKLTVLQFDQGGACMPDFTLSDTLARSPNCLPALTTISLKAAYRLSDAGLKTLVSSAPNLKSVDLSQCSLLTSDGIYSMANSLRLVLRELFLDNCDGVEAMLILPALLMLENLQVLSLAGIQTVSDDFLSKVLSVHGSRMKEIVVGDCIELTDSSLKVIGDSCSGLRALDLTNLCKLTDIGICHLANGCQEIQTLKFCRSAFRS